MSVTRTQETSMNDQSVLSQALKNLGYTPTVLKTAEKIRGHYTEKSTQLCDVVLKKEDHKRDADIGFSRAGNGNYSLVTDTYVNRDIKMKDFTAKIQVEYAKVNAKKVAHSVGATFLGQTTRDGKIILRFAKA